MEPVDLGVYWIEYVLRHKGATHLRSPALELSNTQYLLIDIVALSIVATVATIFILYMLFRCLCTRCIKWWPKEKLMFEKRLFRKNISLILCLLWRHKLKPNWPVFLPKNTFHLTRTLRYNTLNVLCSLAQRTSW